MIAVPKTGTSFRTLVAYVWRNVNGTERSPVAWTAARNLPTDDPEFVVKFMRATAAQSTRVTKPTYHISLSFAPGDVVDRAIMERVADRVLHGLGLAEHQAVIVAHRDRPHQHMHVIVNRVHPETGRTWNDWQDWRRIREILSEEERTLGLRQVHSRWTRVRDLSRELATYERVVDLGRELYRADGDVHTTRERARRLEETAARVRTTLANADRTLAQVYSDPTSARGAYIAAVNAKGLTEATRTMQQHPEQFGALVTVDRSHALGLLHTLDDRPARTAARDAAAAAGEAFEVVRAWQKGAVAEAQRFEAGFQRELEAIYQEPAAARSAFERLVEDQGPEKAVAALRAQPEALGAVQTAFAQEPSRCREQLARAADGGLDAVRARAAANAAEAKGREAPLDGLLALSRAQGERAMARERAIRALMGALPQRVQLERHIRDVLDRLPPRELGLLKTAVTKSQWAIALRFSRIARDIVLGREEERGRSL